MTQEKRSNLRNVVNLPVKWDGSSGRNEARVEDIGLGGCFVNSKGAVQVGEKVALHIKLPTGKWMPVRGQIATYQPGIGFGVIFKPLTISDKVAFGRVFV
jgi:hypothetical protein